MGILRLLLALSVVLSHSGGIYGYNIVGGMVAVETFFMISGFYIGMILNEKYADYNSFLKSRAFRIFPSYFFILSLSVIFFSLTYSPENKNLLAAWIESSDELSTFTSISLILSNIFILGQDTVMFLQFDNYGYFEFTDKFLESSLPVMSFLVIPQAWSLSIELLFYLIAPLIVKKYFILIVLFVLSLIIKATLLISGHNYDPWTYRFVFAETLFFILGIFAYKIYRIEKLQSFYKKWGRVVLPLILLFALSYYFIPLKYIKTGVWYISVWIALPFIFTYSKNSKFDTLLGELSYPIYISHILVIGFVSYAFSTFVSPSIMSVAIIIIITMSISYLTFKYIDKPMSSYRHKKFVSHSEKEYNA